MARPSEQFSPTSAIVSNSSVPSCTAMVPERVLSELCANRQVPDPLLMTYVGLVSVQPVHDPAMTQGAVFEPISTTRSGWSLPCTHGPVNVMPPWAPASQ